MHKTPQLIASTLFLMSATLLAQTPFDGTWRTNMDQSKLSTKPFAFSLNKGMYDCFSCIPKIHVKADGTDQPVTGLPFDMISVRESDRKSVTLTTRKNGKTVMETTRTVSDDGNTLIAKLAFHPENSDQVENEEDTYTRVGKAPAGAHEISGSWRIIKYKESENSLVTTYKSNGDELNMSDPTGVSYTAKLDGKDYPVKGSIFYTSVSLRRVDDHTIEETGKRDGKIVHVSKMTVAPDGKKMTDVYTYMGHTSTYIAEKQ